MSSGWLLLTTYTGCSQEFKDVKEKVEDLVPHLYRFRQNANVATSGGDEAEANRRLELYRYVCWFLTTSVLVNSLRSTLEGIEKRSQELLAKGAAARFLDKSADSAEVAKLVDELREAITHYQVSENSFVGPCATYAMG